MELVHARVTEPASDIETRAQAWVTDIHPHAQHLIRTRDWVLSANRAVELIPAGEALRVAALLHDIERAFPDPDPHWNAADAWDDPVYERYHQDRGARIAAEWLTEQDAPADLTEEVRQLIKVHEDGGWEQANVLQAADSLSFLETLGGDLTIRWVQNAPRLNAPAASCITRITASSSNQPERWRCRY